MTNADKCDALHKHLKKYHTGRENAVSSKELEAAFSLKGSSLRWCVNTLRTNGVPICSDEDGYFYAAGAADIKATVAQLDSRIAKIRKARNGMAQYKSDTE